MKKLAYLSVVLLITASCGEVTKEHKSNSSESTFAAGGESEKELTESLKDVLKEEEEKEKLEKENTTTCTFNELIHDYGNVKPESDNTCFFIVTNTGKKPLIIDKVDASCGCTTPIKPEKPILPGQSDKIKVVFHPKAEQLGEQNKTVTVTANTEPRITILKIKAFVK